MHLPQFVSIIKLHDIDYARTLREWGTRFQRNFESHIAPAMKKEYPQLSEEELLIFKRKFICK